MNPENFDQPTFAEILRAHEDEIARLTAELAGAREDAERYRWLRDCGFNLPDLPYKRQTFAENVAEIEAAIDADRLVEEAEDE